MNRIDSMLRSRHGVTARHSEKSMLFSADDDPVGPSPRLLDVALAAAAAAREVDLTHLDARLGGPPAYASQWPGEHYRLLTALGRVIEPAQIIEIGTATGLSALALREGAPDATVTTFDIVPWHDYPGSILTEADFAGGRLVQHIADLSYPAGMTEHRTTVGASTLIFVDAAKDGEQETRFLEQLATVDFTEPPIVVFDDIRLWNMLSIWRTIGRPKLDLTSFGHWSGTGLVDFS